MAASSRRADLEATLATAGIVCLVDGPEQALAVANAIAPEHLQLMVPDEEGLALLDLVQNAGAVFIGDWSPASMGDYIAGPNHVLPTNRTARFASALRADDFRKHVHAVRVTPGRAARPRPARRHAGRDRGPAGPRRLGAAPPRPRSTSEGAPVSAVPPVRPDLQLAEGYHSPQVDAEVRLNTNESPFAPPDAWREELLAALAEVSFHRYPDRPATELRQAVADLHGVTPDEVFCANGSNEVLQCLLLAFGGPGRRALVFEPTYALHSHIARITGTELSSRARDDDFLIDPRRRARPSWPRSAPTSPSSARRTTRPGGPSRARPSPPCCAAAPGLVIVDEAYGQFSPSSALELRGPAQPGLVVTRTFSKTWAMAGARLGYLVADPGRGRGVRVGRAALPPVGPDADGRPGGAAPRARDGGAGGPHLRGAGEGGRRVGRPAGGQLALRRQLHPLPAPRPRRGRGVAVAARPLGPHPQLRRAGTACAAACASPSGRPRRTTASSTP